MKKSICIAMVMVFLAVCSAKAVVIHWAVSTLPSGATSAQLVYVSSGVPAFANDSLSNGENVGSLVSGLAVTPLGIGEQNTSDGTTRNTGNYYVVLFNNSSQFAYSSALAYNNTTFISQDEFTPATGTFDPATFSNWAPVPEPASAALFLLGVSLLALRRKKMA